MSRSMAELCALAGRTPRRLINRSAARPTVLAIGRRFCVPGFISITPHSLRRTGRSGTFDIRRCKIRIAIVPSPSEWLESGPTVSCAVHGQTIVFRNRTVGRSRYRGLQIRKGVGKEAVVNERAVGKLQATGRCLTGSSKPKATRVNQSSHRNLKGDIYDIIARAASVWISCQVSAQRAESVLGTHRRNGSTGVQPKHLSRHDGRRLIHSVDTCQERSDKVFPWKQTWRRDARKYHLNNCRKGGCLDVLSELRIVDRLA